MQHNLMCRKNIFDSIIGIRVLKCKCRSIIFLFIIVLIEVFYLDAMFYRIVHWAGKFAIISVWVNILCHCFRVDLENSLPFVLYHFASVISSFHLVIMEL